MIIASEWAEERCRAVERDAFERPCQLVNVQSGVVVARYASLADAYAKLAMFPAPAGCALGFAP